MNKERDTAKMKMAVSVKYWCLPIIIFTTALVFSYWPTIQLLAQQWLNNDDFSHGLLVLPIALYVVWEERNKIYKANVYSDWRALPVMLFAVGLFIVGELGAELFTTRVAMILTLISAIWLFYGPELIKTIRFPLAFLFLMLPLPGFIYRNITFPLQLLSSIWSIKILHLFGISAYREGNVIDLGFTQFQVVEACNGLRFILPLFTMGVLFAFWFGKNKAPWKRILLVFASIPIAMLSNILRIAGTGIISLHWGVEAAQGFFHDFSGWVVFMVSLGFYFLLNIGLNFLPGHVKTPPKEQEDEEPNHKHRPRRNILWGPVAAAVVVVLATPAVTTQLGSVPPKPLHRPLQDFPVQFNGWTGKTSLIPPLIWEQVGGQDYVQIDYYKKDALPVNFYTAYYEYQRKGGDFVHSPKLCLPGAGWFIKTNTVRSVDFDGKDAIYGGEIRFNELLISKGNFRQLVYYWYQGRGRNFTNEYMAKFYMVWDGIVKRRTDGALVRLIRPIAPNETVLDARYILDEFVVETSRELETFFP